MQHRHLDTHSWTLAAIDSALEYGSLPEWRELFAAVRRDRQVARDVLHVASRHDLGGASLLARELVLRIYPNLTQS